ncbi:hypothetical protein BG006_001418 [Podila minutissima]|uniref:Uncharacterized protein n=1 Tax=Podila minutissima TaxID=64525 RepID=A0A9P5VP47_9FUNG|nr:hypothetical protein BG006_001418 [Podila minutissima]
MSLFLQKTMNHEQRSAEFVSGDKAGKICDSQAAQAHDEAQQQNQDGHEHRTAEFVSANQADKKSQQPQKEGARRAQ